MHGDSAMLLFTRPHPAVMPDRNIAPTPLRKPVAMIGMNVQALADLSNTIDAAIQQIEEQGRGTNTNSVGEQDANRLRGTTGWDASVLTAAADENLRVLKAATKLLPLDWASKVESASRIFGADRALLLIEAVAGVKLMMLSVAFPFRAFRRGGAGLTGLNSP
jgi:hypothetical protein